jgi:hypothetical protein
MAEKILQSIKESLLIVSDYTVYDSQIMDDINAVFSTLHQLGYHYVDGFEITTGDETWDEIIPSKKFNFVKRFILCNVRLMFDPPSSSFAVDALNKEIEELKWRINVEMETGGD